MNDVVLITGASAGIGKVCAEYLTQRGYKVYRASRSLPEEISAGTLRMDVDNEDSVSSAIDLLTNHEGRIDVIVNCAGFGIAGAVEDTSIEEAKAQLETNFFGTLRVCKAVLPSMRKQGSGLIVNISSIAGLVSLPFQGFYSASKFALEGMTEALRMEVAPFGIRVVLVEPGDFKTEFSANRKQTEAARNSSGYRDYFHKALVVYEKEEATGGDPLAIARLVERLIRTSSPNLRYSIGRVSERFAPFLKQVLPYKLYERLFMQHFGLR